MLEYVNNIAVYAVADGLGSAVGVNVLLCGVCVVLCVDVCLSASGRSQDAGLCKGSRLHCSSQDRE